MESPKWELLRFNDAKPELKSDYEQIHRMLNIRPPVNESGIKILTNDINEVMKRVFIKLSKLMTNSPKILNLSQKIKKSKSRKHKFLPYNHIKDPINKRIRIKTILSNKSKDKSNKDNY
jgi:hypothetical protein